MLYTKSGNPGTTSHNTAVRGVEALESHHQAATDRPMVSVQGQSLYGGSRGFVRVESEEKQPPLREVQGSGVKLVSTPPFETDSSDDGTSAFGIAWRFRKVQVGSRCQGASRPPHYVRGRILGRWYTPWSGSILESRTLRTFLHYHTAAVFPQYKGYCCTARMVVLVTRTNLLYPVYLAWYLVLLTYCCTHWLPVTLGGSSVM